MFGRIYKLHDTVTATRDLHSPNADSWLPADTVPAGTEGYVTKVRDYVYYYPYNVAFGDIEIAVTEDSIKIV